MEGAATIRAAFRPDATPVQAYQMPAGSQTHSQTVLFAGQTGIDPIERIEDPFQMLVRDTDPEITDTQLPKDLAACPPHTTWGTFRRDRLNDHLNPSTIWGVQHRIVHQVLHHLPQAEQISLNEGRGLTSLPLRIPTLHYRAYTITTASHTRGGSRPSPLIVLLLTVKR